MYQTFGFIELHNLSKGQLSDMKSYEKPLFTITGRSSIQLLQFWRFNFSNFQTTFVKNFMKNFQFSKYILKVLIKSYRFTNICDLKILYTQAAALWIFLEISTEERFASLVLSNEGNIKASILLILLKCIVTGYSNGNESFTGRFFLNYGSLNMLLHFFRYLIYSVFHETFVKNFMKKLSFSSSNFKNPSQDVVHYRKLRCLTLWYWNGSPLRVKSWKNCPFLGLFLQK